MKITVGKDGEFETIADVLERMGDRPDTYELEVRYDVYVYPEGAREAVDTTTITIPTKEEKKMEELMDQLKRVPRSYGGMISRATVLEIVGDYLAEHPFDRKLDFRPLPRAETPAKEEEPDPSDRIEITAQPDGSFTVKTYVDGGTCTVWLNSADKMLSRIRTFVKRHRESWAPVRGRWSITPSKEPETITIHIKYPEDFSFRMAREIQKALEDAIQNLSISYEVVP